MKKFTNFSFTIFALFLILLSVIFFNKEVLANTLVDYTDLTPWVLNTPNDTYPTKGFIVEPTVDFSFNNIQVLTKKGTYANPYMPITFCLWQLDESYNLLDKIECSNTKYSAYNLPTTFVLKDFDFKDYVLLSGNKYAFVYGPDEYIGFSPSEVEGNMGWGIMQGIYAEGINKYAAWTEGYNSLLLLVSSEASIFSINSTPFFAKVKNTGGFGYANIYQDHSIASQILKQVPEDWIIRVDDTTDDFGNPIIGASRRWYKVTDPTDSVSGWMAGATYDGNTRYLSIDTQNQDQLESDSTNLIIYEDRPNTIIDAVDHYYNNSDENYSLYSSDDGANNISTLKDRGFPEKVIWGIAATESGNHALGFDFKNDLISADYGHGIFQITLSPGHWDNRGIGSKIKIPLCEGVATALYINCYTNIIGGLRSYKNYADIPSNPIYKYYSNTKQSIYSNTKDAMRILQQKYSGVHITTPITIGPYTYSPTDREIITVTQMYNGSKCKYLKDVSTNLNNIDDFFPGQTAVEFSDLINKMYYAGFGTTCVSLHSPGELYVEDENGNRVGVVNGKGVNEFPMAVYDKEEKFVKIMFPDKNYKYKVVGTGIGTYGIDISILDEEQEVSFSGKVIPIKKGEIHTYVVNKDLLKEGEKGVTISVDKNGDGKVEALYKSSNNMVGLQD